MICPHCQRTIAEQQQYLMSRDPDADIHPRWITIAIIAASFVAIVGILTLAAT